MIAVPKKPEIKLPWPVHPLAECWELIEGQDWKDFLEDVRKNGIWKPVLLVRATDEGVYDANLPIRLVDGRQRARAGQEAGKSIPSEEWNGQGSLIALVTSLNQFRRHDSIESREMTAAKLIPYFEAELQRGRGTGRAATAAATATGTSTRGVQRARRIIDQGTPELIEAVEERRIAPSRAEKLVALPPEEQIKAVSTESKSIQEKDLQDRKKDLIHEVEKLSKRWNKIVGRIGIDGNRLEKGMHTLKTAAVNAINSMS